MTKKKHRVSIDIPVPTWKKIRLDAVNKNITAKEVMEKTIQDKYKNETA